MTLINTHTRVPTVPSSTTSNSSAPRTPFRANPIRHARVGHGFGSDGAAPTPSHSRRISIDALNRPGGMSVTSTTNPCDGTDPSLTPVLLNKVVSDDSCQNAHLKSRPATTNIAPSYSTTTQEYLKMRARTFEQNAAPHQLHTPSVDAGGNPIQCNVAHQPVPSNHKYYASGAVSSGTRIERLKHEATRRRTGIRNLPPAFTNNGVCKKC